MRTLAKFFDELGKSLVCHKVIGEISCTHLNVADDDDFFVCIRFCHELRREKVVY